MKPNKINTMKNMFIVFLMLCSINIYCQKEDMLGIWYRNFTDNIHLIVVQESDGYNFINFNEKENIMIGEENIIKITDSYIETSFTNDIDQTMYFKYEIVNGPDNEKMLHCLAREEGDKFYTYSWKIGRAHV